MRRLRRGSNDVLVVLGSIVLLMLLLLLLVLLALVLDCGGSPRPGVLGLLGLGVGPNSNIRYLFQDEMISVFFFQLLGRWFFMSGWGAVVVVSLLLYRCCIAVVIIAVVIL